MSRCFPFPPPGYEKQIRIDETDLLTKEKLKEKKQKKDKDREKKEVKEKKDKERSKEKHREKKEKKEKKEKQKDRKEKDRDNEKNRTPDEKKIEARSDGKGGEKLGTYIMQNNNNGNSKYVQDLERRIRDEEKATGSQIVQKIKIADQRNAGMPGRVLENNSCYPLQENNHKREDDKRVVSGQRNFAVAKCSENAVGREFFGMDQKRVEAVKPVEKKDVGKQMEGKEKTRHKETESKSDKPKDKDREKKTKGKDKDQDKEKMEINKPSQEQPKFIEGGPRVKQKDKDSLDIHSSKPPDILRASNKGNFGKRKEPETNGILYENGNRPNKLQRPVPSSLSAMENGRKLGPSQTPINSTSGPLRAVNNCKPDIKEHRINGFTMDQKPKVLPPSSLPATTQANGNSGTSVKPPHSDLKYLSQILSTPERTLPEFDDQEWLFSSTEMNLKKPKMDSSVLDETRQVWDQALRIEFADISALPYVIPY